MNLGSCLQGCVLRLVVVAIFVMPTDGVHPGLLT